MLPEDRTNYQEILEASQTIPCISLIMPFEPKMSLETELSYKLDLAADKIEKEIRKRYSGEDADPVMERLRHLLKRLDYNTHKKSIAIFVSKTYEKVYYLDLPLDEKIVIDDTFEIRDLIYSKHEIHKYLLAVLSSKHCKVYLGNTVQFFPVLLNTPDHVAAYANEIPEKVANFSDEHKRKEIMLEKFLHHIDTALTQLLHSYNLPLFVMGTDRTIGHFKKISHNTDRVLNYVHGNFEDKTEAELKAIMEPYVADWRRIIQQDLLHQIESARNANRVAIGLREVCKDVLLKKGRLLILEKNYLLPANFATIASDMERYRPSDEHAFYIKDAIDDLIERVLASGGDVEFVDEGLLNHFQKMVLIEYYPRS